MVDVIFYGFRGLAQFYGLGEAIFVGAGRLDMINVAVDPAAVDVLTQRRLADGGSFSGTDAAIYFNGGGCLHRNIALPSLLGQIVQNCSLFSSVASNALTMQNVVVKPSSDVTLSSPSVYVGNDLDQCDICNSTLLGSVTGPGNTSCTLAEACPPIPTGSSGAQRRSLTVERSSAQRKPASRHQLLELPNQQPEQKTTHVLVVAVRSTCQGSRDVSSLIAGADCGLANGDVKSALLDTFPQLNTAKVTVVNDAIDPLALQDYGNIDTGDEGWHHSMESALNFMTADAVLDGGDGSCSLLSKHLLYVVTDSDEVRVVFWCGAVVYR